MNMYSILHAFVISDRLLSCVTIAFSAVLYSAAKLLVCLQ